MYVRREQVKDLYIYKCRIVRSTNESMDRLRFGSCQDLCNSSNDPKTHPWIENAENEKYSGRCCTFFSKSPSPGWRCGCEEKEQGSERWIQTQRPQRPRSGLNARGRRSLPFRAMSRSRLCAANIPRLAETLYSSVVVAHTHAHAIDALGELRICGALLEIRI